MINFTSAKKFLECAWRKMMHSGTFPEANGNVWGALYGQAETY